MIFRKLSIDEFTDFQKNHPLSNFYQTVNYGMLMAEYGYDYELVGLVDYNDNILAASLILLKAINLKNHYGYAPRGFLIDYENKELLKEFTEELCKYYYNKDVVFIKINPKVILSEIDNKKYDVLSNTNEFVINNLRWLGYKKLKSNLYFEAELPRFNAIVNLFQDDTNKYNKNTKNKIRKSIRKGLKFQKYPKEYLSELYKIINDNNTKTFYYNDIYTVFDKNDSIDLFLVTIDSDEYLQNSQYIYDKELDKNELLNKKLINNNGNRIINAKMQSDKSLLSYKNDIIYATKLMTDNNKDFIAGAITIKHNDTVTVIANHFDKKYKDFAPNYFLYYSIIKYYENDYKYLDLFGVVGDFKNENKYTGLNRFKLGFNPNIYEYIGEYDLVINEKKYNTLLSNGSLLKEFKK